MANITLKELQSVLEKSGAPLGQLYAAPQNTEYGNSLAMRQAAPFLRDTLNQNIQVQDPQIPALRDQGNKLRKDYFGQIDQIAGMDAKLGKLYGDPSSQLYIENPVNRLSAQSGASDVGYKAVAGVSDKIDKSDQLLKQREAEVERTKKATVDDALQLYGQLASLQEREERIAETADKERQAEAKRNAAAIKKQRAALGLDLQDKTGLTGDALEVFRNAPSTYQKSYLESKAQLEAKGQRVAPITGEELKADVKEYNAKYKVKSTNDDKLDQLRAALGLDEDDEEE